MHESDVIDLTGWPTILVYKLLLDYYRTHKAFPTVFVSMLNLSNWRDVPPHPDRITLTYREFSDLVAACEISKIFNHGQQLLYYLSQEKLNNGQA